MFSIPRIQDLNGMIHRRSTFVVYCGPWILHILVSIIPCLESFRRLSIFPHGNFAWMASAEILKVLDFEIVPPESISAHHWQLSEAYTNGKPCYVCVLGGCFHHNATWGTYSLRSFPETLTLAKREEECDNSCFFFLIQPRSTHLAIGSLALTGPTLRTWTATLHVPVLWFVVSLALQLDLRPCHLFPMQLDRCQASQLSCLWGSPGVCPTPLVFHAPQSLGVPWGTP